MYANTDTATHGRKYVIAELLGKNTPVTFKEVIFLGKASISDKQLSLWFKNTSVTTRTYRMGLSADTLDGDPLNENVFYCVSAPGRSTFTHIQFAITHHLLHFLHIFCLNKLWPHAYYHVHTLSRCCVWEQAQCCVIYSHTDSCVGIMSLMTTETADDKLNGSVICLLRSK